MIYRLLTICIVIGLAGLWILTTSTSPATIHPLGILLFFAFLYLVCVGIVTFLLYGVRQVLMRVMPSNSHRRRLLSQITIQKTYLYATVLALAPVILLAMQSVGASGLIDICLIVIFEILACFYIWRRS